MKPGKIITVFLLIISMVTMTGCWNYHELDQMAMVAGVAVDRGTNGYRYHLTIEYLDTSSSAIKSKLMETDGNSIFDAIQNATSISERVLYFADCKLIIISQDLASEGIAPLLDWALRDPEPRITIIPVIAQTKTAGEILHHKSVSGDMKSIEIWRSISENRDTLSETPDTKLYQTVDKLANPAISLILPSITGIQMQNEMVCKLGGAAIFKKDKFIGFLKPEETKMLLFVKNKVKGGQLTFSPLNDGQTITLEIKSSKTKITPSIENSKASMKVDIEVRVALTEDETRNSYVNTEGLKKAESSAAKYLESGIAKVIETTQTEYDSDVFGFGLTLFQNDPSYWNQHSKTWDKEFKNLKPTINANVTIESTATTKDKIEVS